MFKEEYQAAFSKVTASSETHRRVMNMVRKKKRSTMGAISKILIAAVLTSLLVITVSASETLSSWFAEYFGRNNEEPLTTEQVVYFEENEQNFHQSVTVDGYTMVLKSAVTDGEMAYICLGVTAPEDVVLNETIIEGYSPEKPVLRPSEFNESFLTDMNGNGFLGYSSIASVENYDGLSNTQDLVIKLHSDPQTMPENPFGEDMVWKLRFENLIAQYRNVAYMQELDNGKYAGQENYFYTDEEGELAYPKVTLAEGVWEFEVRFENPDIREVELIDTPITAKVSMGCDGNGQDVYTDVTLTSFVLRSLSASIVIDDATFVPDFTSGSDIYVMMKDGSKVLLISEGGGAGEQQLRAEAPVLLENADYVLIGSDIKLSVTDALAE